MVAILHSEILVLAILDSAILVFTSKITHTCQDWFPPFAKKTSLIHSDSTGWWQPSWILPSWIWPSWIQLFSKKNSWLIHSHWTWWWQPSWILPCWIQTPSSWIQTPCYLLSDSLKNTLTPLWLWLKLIQSDSNSFILIELDDGSHLAFWNLEFGHLGFSHLIFLSQTHSHLPRLVPTICTKNFIHLFWLNLMVPAILKESDIAILDSDTLLSSLRFTQKHSHSTLTLTQTNSIWLKLIHCQLTWWW